VNLLAHLFCASRCDSPRHQKPHRTMRSDMFWSSSAGLPSRSYTCGHCGNPLVSHDGWFATFMGSGAPQPVAYIYICHFCRRPTFFAPDGKQMPGASIGMPVSGIHDASVSAIYEEARAATSAGCYSAAVMCCRKLLMHIAVSKGAKPGEIVSAACSAAGTHISSKKFDCSPRINAVRRSS
jgi:hypothetical protein